MPPSALKPSTTASSALRVFTSGGMAKSVRLPILMTWVPPPAAAAVVSVTAGSGGLGAAGGSRGGGRRGGRGGGRVSAAASGKSAAEAAGDGDGGAGDAGHFEELPATDGALARLLGDLRILIAHLRNPLCVPVT